jgi:methionyl aminopeptidase
VGRRQEKEKRARRRVASERREHAPRRTPVRPGHLSPDRTVPASIARPHYAPDAPPFVPAVPPDELADRMRAAGHAGREILLELADAVAVGMTTDELDRICHEACIARGGYPSPLHYKGFPKSLCTSVNEVICHGIPDDRALVDGDIVNCDVTIYLHGVHGDCNATFFVGDVDNEGRRLVQVTREALWKGIEQGRPGARLYEVGRAIQQHAEAAGFGVVRSFVGHGVGEEFHTAPAVLHYYDPSADLVLTPGLTFTIEPMINEGSWELGRIWPDGWTAPTRDGSRSAQFEHSLLVTATGVEVLTLLPGEPHGS